MDTSAAEEADEISEGRKGRVNSERAFDISSKTIVMKSTRHHLQSILSGVLVLVALTPSATKISLTISSRRGKKLPKAHIALFMESSG